MFIRVAAAVLMFSSLQGCMLARLPIWAKAPTQATVPHAPLAQAQR